MTKRAVPLTIALLWLVSALPAESRLLAPVEVLQGRLLRAAVHPAATDGTVRGVLRRNDGAVLAADGFLASFPEEGTAAVVLFGIPSTLPTGVYELEVVQEAGGVQVLLSQEVRVLEDAFADETIPLNKALTDIRAKPDPRKTEQSRELYALLTTTNPDVWYHGEALALPLAGARRTSSYGDRRTYRYANGSTAKAIHFGLDLAAPTGTPVAAAGGGKVVFAGDRIVTGLTVVLEHLPGVYTLYYHLNDLAVAEGDVVEQGTPLGGVGSTGLATGPHLHWEVRVSGVPVKPEPLVSLPVLDKDSIFGMLSGYFPEEGR
jgi:murein DD-endopeptidase MepM/ murein hydrolase activator NlpD